MSCDTPLSLAPLADDPVSCQMVLRLFRSPDNDFSSLLVEREKPIMTVKRHSEIEKRIKPEMDSCVVVVELSYYLSVEYRRRGVYRLEHTDKIGIWDYEKGEYVKYKFVELKPLF